MVGIVNYERGNLNSVSKALEKVGAEVKLVSSPHEMTGLDAVVLPGVGAFGDAAKNLQEKGLWEPVRDWVKADRPFFGICLGYQLLFESSEETPGIAGLGVFQGRVKRFQAVPGMKVPHMGWECLEIKQPSLCLWDSLPSEPWVYFVHSYFVAPEEPALTSSVVQYGEEFAASIAVGNCFATQFHPEKSQAVGLQMLENFVRKFCLN